MIDILAKVHDKYSVEFKVGYRARKKVKLNRFMMNTWIFVPGSLDINRKTYSREDFYRDLKYNIRLITPVFLLRDIAKKESQPLSHLESSFNHLASHPSRSAQADYEYQIKMFSAIFKSAIRDHLHYIFLQQNLSDRYGLFDDFLKDMQDVLTGYRSLSHLIKIPTVPHNVYNYYEFGDEFMSGLVENHLFSVIEKHCQEESEFSHRFKEKILNVIQKEQQHKLKHGYPVVSAESPDNNMGLVFRRGLLKKFVESDLFLNARKKKDGIFTEQIYLSLAAGISMVFATAVAFSFQQRFGSYTMPLFVALVVSYMLKDRIKELMRHYFAHNKSTKYFDNKITVSVKENQIGWSKEGFDFISEKKVPEAVMKIRNRSALLEADNRYASENIILYRKLVLIDREKLDENSKYFIAGINEILKFNVHSFLNKMDNPGIPLYVTPDGVDIVKLEGMKVYYLNFVVQLKYEDFERLIRYRVTFNRDGIKSIEELS
jgi:hypothetical protein